MRKMLRRTRIVPPPLVRELRKEWHNATAKYHYVLYEPAVMHDSTFQEYHYFKKVACGNKAWAEKTARHYGLSISREGKQS